MGEGVTGAAYVEADVESDADGDRRQHVVHVELAQQRRNDLRQHTRQLLHQSAHQLKEPGEGAIGTGPAGCIEAASARKPGLATSLRRGGA